MFISDPRFLISGHMRLGRADDEIDQKVENQAYDRDKAADLGGGFGVRYTERISQLHRGNLPPNRRKSEEELKRNEIRLEKIMIEPGRSFVAEAGYTLYSVGYLKNTPNQAYLFIDGGMSDNIRWPYTTPDMTAILPIK
jgi:diaminopimelate decarboxylase